MKISFKRISRVLQCSNLTVITGFDFVTPFVFVTRTKYHSYVVFLKKASRTILDSVCVCGGGGKLLVI